MSLTTEYGYFIKALREYPFTEQIKRRCEEIEYPLKPHDENWHIKGTGGVYTAKALSDLIKKESDPVLHKYELLKCAIDETVATLSSKEWKVIKDVYINRSMTVEGATMKHLNYSRKYGYEKLIKPFFEKLEMKFYGFSLDGKTFQLTR